jgi:hypothetical protein
MAMKDHLRHTTVKTTENFYIGSDIEYQHKQNERLVINSGNIVEKWNIGQNGDIVTA